MIQSQNQLQQLHLSSNNNELKENAKSAINNVLKNYLKAQEGMRLWCFTDRKRRWLAEAFCTEARLLGLKPNLMVLTGDHYLQEDIQPLQSLLQGMTDQDVVLSVFSFDPGGQRIPYWSVFPNLKAPQAFAGVSAVIRPYYPDDALLKHLQTDIVSVRHTANHFLMLNKAQKVRVKGVGGTDLVCELMPGKALSYEISDIQRHAFLPPAEVTYGVVPGSATGNIVIDVTVGELATRKDGVLDSMGLVDAPVHMKVEQGEVTEISGGKRAEQLDEWLKRLKSVNRKLVELGFGLSQGQPTGVIGPDECLQGTGHFGIGHDGFYGGHNLEADIHLDLVFNKPQIDILQWREVE